MNLRQKNFKEISKKKTGSKVHHLARNPSFFNWTFDQTEFDSDDDHRSDGN